MFCRRLFGDWGSWGVGFVFELRGGNIGFGLRGIGLGGCEGWL